MYARRVTLFAVLALALGGLSLPAFAAKPDKAEVCHFQEETATWKLLSIGAPALRAHLLHHDDALPGGVTTETETALDADCLASCPCEGLTNGAVVWDATFAAVSCSVAGGVTTVVGVTGALSVDSATGSCSLGVPIVLTGLSVGEVAACELSLAEIALADGATCVVTP